MPRTIRRRCPPAHLSPGANQRFIRAGAPRGERDSCALQTAPTGLSGTRIGSFVRSRRFRCASTPRTVRQTLPVPNRIRRSRFETKLLVIVVAALAWRVGYVLVTKRHADLWGDAFGYHYGANLLAEGKGFIDPLRYEFAGLKFPSAYHPPLYFVYLAGWSLIGLKSVLWHRLVSCLVGAITVGLIGYLGRRLGGDRAGLIAAVLAAAYPHLWLNDAALLS